MYICYNLVNINRIFTNMFLILLIMYLDFVSRKATADNSSVSTEEYFPTKITPLCDAVPGRIVITGYIVKFSEIVKPDGTLDNHCGNNSNVTKVYIFAKQKVFIDQNINARGFDIFILAPKWEVVTVCVINLNGLDGEPISTTPLVIGTGWDGVDGSPGNPGSPGGNFFGVGETFINGKQLTIDVSGGVGGVGQDGGAGGPGQDGRRALLANLSLTCSHSACDDTGTQTIALVDDAGNYTNFKCKQEYNYIIYDMFFLPPVSGNVRECYYYIYGSDGPVAGAGGDGGRGGKGGYPGQVYLLELLQSSEITIVNSTGKTGKDGRGAQSGNWAYSGWDVSFKKRETYSNQEPYISGTAEIKYIDSHRVVSLEHALGVDGGNSHFIKEPVRGKLVGIRELYNAMAEFTKFVSNHSMEWR